MKKYILKNIKQQKNSARLWSIQQAMARFFRLPLGRHIGLSDQRLQGIVTW